MDQSQLEALKIITNLIVQVSPELFSMLKEVVQLNRNIEAKLENINKKLDNLIVREIQSSFQLIEGIRRIESQSMKDRHLIEAESNLLKNISLDLSLTTAGYPNAFWSGQAFYGLSLIAILRMENEDAARLLLRTFILNPRMARTYYAWSIYETQFKPFCNQFFAKYNGEMQKLAAYNTSRTQIKSQLSKKNWIKWGTLAGGTLIGVLAKNPGLTRVASNSTQKLTQEIEALEKQLAAIPTEESIKNDLENGIDAKCQAIAEKLLQ